MREFAQLHPFERLNMRLKIPAPSGKRLSLSPHTNACSVHITKSFPLHYNELL